MPNMHCSVCSHIIAPTIAGAKPEIAGLVVVTQTLHFSWTTLYFKLGYRDMDVKDLHICEKMKKKITT